eukprot:655544-Hanusia_phi.AAC.1
METGGIMAEIRTLTVEKIRAYHAEYYRPDNMCIIITGKVKDRGWQRGFAEESGGDGGENPGEGAPERQAKAMALRSCTSTAAVV